MPPAMVPEFGGTSVRVGRPMAAMRRVESSMAMKVPSFGMALELLVIVLVVRLLAVELLAVASGYLCSTSINADLAQNDCVRRWPKTVPGE